MIDFGVDIGPIIATNDDIVMDVNEEPIHVESLALMLCCTSPSSHSPEDGLHHTGILTFPCTIVDSRTDLYEEVGTDVEMWCNHGLKKKG